MKNNNGFTLIELLAVIVILAIIALVATPIILNLISEAKESAFKDSVSMAISSSDLYAQVNDIDLTNGVSINDLTLSNSDLKYGTIILEDNELKAVNVSNGEYCANGTLGDMIIYDGDCDTLNPEPPTINSDEIYDEEVIYTITQNGEITSGIYSYEYYLSDVIIDSEEEDAIVPTGESFVNTITINIDTAYIYFRIVSNAGKNGEWARSINYTDVLLQKKYIVVDGVLQDNLVFTTNNSNVTFGTSSDLFFSTTTLVGSYGGWINVDFTKYDKLTIYAKHNIGDPYVSGGRVGSVGYANESTINTGGSRSYVMTKTLTKYEFDISGVTGVHAISIYSSNQYVTCPTTTYASSIILE